MTTTAAAAKLVPPPTQSAAAALDAFLSLDEATESVGAYAFLAALASWTHPEEQPPLARALRELVGAYDAASLFAALRHKLAPEGRLRSLFTDGGPSLRWRQARDVYLAKLFLHDDRIDRRALARLRRQDVACPRAEWAAAFGLSLPRPSRWQSSPPAARLSLRLLAQVRRAGGSLAALSLPQLLVLAQHGALDEACSSAKVFLRHAHGTQVLTCWTTDPEGGWRSPLAYFVHGCMHYGIAYTSEAVQALATYLDARCAALGCTEVIEVGAGDGRLAHLLNACDALRSRRVIPTDPMPKARVREVMGSTADEPVDFPVEVNDSEGALVCHRPSLVLCAFMGCGQDWTAAWRAAGVKEYVLLGALGEGETSYRCLNEPAPDGYEKLLLEDVSRELLDPAHADPHARRVRALAEHDAGVAQAVDDRVAETRAATLCAVSFRRKV